MLLLGFIFGGCLSSLARFLVGAAFHFLPSIEIWHESFHDRLRRKWLFDEPLLWQDTFLEIIATAAVLLATWLCPLQGVLCGAAVELAVTWFLRTAATSPGFRESRFMANMQIYYMWHLFVDPQTNWGFSMPFWDWLFGRHMRAAPDLSPMVPFFAFWLDDYRRYHIDPLKQAVEACKANPVQFADSMREGSERRKASCTVCRRMHSVRL